jgi:hypothetical protein
MISNNTKCTTTTATTTATNNNTNEKEMDSIPFHSIQVCDSL